MIRQSRSNASSFYRNDSDNYERRPVMMTTAARIGAVNYLNSKPLIEGLQDFAPQAEIVLDYPSRLADGLADGLLDVALVPSIACLQSDRYDIISDACVATRGPVLSVKLYSRVPAGAIQTLALDEGSRTSSVLAQIVLAHRFGVHPDCVPFPLGKTVSDVNTDAILMIGDRAIHDPEESFVETWDLGEEWTRWTGLPFVFAMWILRKDAGFSGLDETLCQARDEGVMRIPEIASREAANLNIATETAVDYLTHNLHFRLGSAERSGLRLFHDLAVQQGLAPKGVDLVFRDCTPA